jgi:fatty-acyl-CoA synthase
MIELTASYVCGTADVPLLGETIGQSLDLAVQRWGDREALVSPSHDVRWTWREFAGRVDALAAGFLALGLERGARIGVWSLNRPEWTLTQFAAAKAGIILVTINPAYRLSELEFALAKVGCAAIVTATAFKTSNYMEMLNTLLPELAATARGDPDRRTAFARRDRIRGRDADGRRASPRDAGGARQDAAVRRPRQYTIHQRHHRLAQGRDADAPQYPQ